MNRLHYLLAVILTAACTTTMAGQPILEAPLPLLNIEDRGELTYSDDDFNFVPWRSDQNRGTVHIVQYFGATMSGSKLFRPFIDLLDETLDPGAFHVTTIINLDAALWGTTGFVVSELKKNKRMHPSATMVVDEDGEGVDLWGLGDAGAGMAVVDGQGKVKYFTRKTMSAEEMKETLELVRLTIDG